jgi:hypothetical protein
MSFSTNIKKEKEKERREEFDHVLGIPIEVQTAKYDQLTRFLKVNLSPSETVRVIRMNLNQETGYDTILMKATTSGSVLVFSIWLDTNALDKYTCIYKTINKQIIVFKMVLKNKPVILFVNCGPVRGMKCFYVENTYEKGASGYNFGLQAYSRWIVPGWNPLCPDYLPSDFRGVDNWEEHCEIDLIAHHVHHYAYPPWILYGLTCLFPCCLCPQICLARFGNFYRIEDRDMYWAPIVDSAIKITEITNTDGSNPELTVGGLFPPYEPQGPQAAFAQYMNSPMERSSAIPISPSVNNNNPNNNFRRSSAPSLLLPVNSFASSHSASASPAVDSSFSVANPMRR